MQVEPFKSSALQQSWWNTMFPKLFRLAALYRRKI